MFTEWNELDAQKKDLYIQGKINEAILVSKRMLITARSIFTWASREMANTLNDLAVLYAASGQWAEAEPLYLEALSIYRQLLDDTPTAISDLATGLTNLATLYTQTGTWNKAELLHLESVNVSRQLSGQELSNTFATSLNNLAHFYDEQGKWDEAESFHLEAIHIRRQLLHETSNEVIAYYLAATLSNLGGNYTAQGRWDEGEPLFLEALGVFHQLLGEKAINNDLASVLNNLGRLYFLKGQFTKSESFYLETIYIRHQLSGELASHELAGTLNNLAQLYMMQGKDSEAESLLIESLDILRRLFGNEPHKQIAINLDNLGTLYSNQGRLTEAENLCEEALDILRRLFLEAPNATLAGALNSLANIYIDRGRWDEAEVLYLEALDILRKLFPGTLDANLAANLNNLGNSYTHQGRWDEAEVLYLEALDISYKLFGEHGHPSLVINHRSYAYLLIKKENFMEALEHFVAAARVDIKVLSEYFQGKAEAERLAYRVRRQSTLDLVFSCLWQYLPDNSKAIALAFEVVYLWKSVVTALETSLSATISRSEDLELQQAASNRQKLRYQLNQLNQIIQKPLIENIKAHQNIEAYQREVRKLQTQLDDLEKEIEARIPHSQRVETTIESQVINQLVPADATLVDFVRFDLYNFLNQEKWESYYLAFVLTHGGLEEIRLVRLGAAAEIDDLVSRFRQAVSNLPDEDVEKMAAITNARFKNPANLLTPYQAPAHNLRQAILDSLNLPTHHPQIILAPDGDLNLVPFGILPLDNGIVSDRWSIRYVSASRDLRPRIQPPKPASIGTIAANPNYDFPADTSAPVSIDPIQKSGTSSTLSHKLTPLPQTESLAQKIAQSVGIKPLLGNDAQARNLRQVRSPKYFLIATHGLHGLDPVDDNHPDPMRDAGLALAGFNTVMSGNELPAEFEQGRLTARDLLELDLWGNQITILLACSSGTGYVHQGEGIFGLKRALAIAGVSTLIVSLWDVPIQASILLMDKFFEYFQGGANLPAAAALQEAQAYVRNISRKELLLFEQGRSILQEFDDKEIEHLRRADFPLQHPMFWGAWICQG
jgi:tetratricopeptide (TPR) repeat protein